MTGPANLGDSLRQMLALLENERQALAAMDGDRILACADDKLDLCEAIERYGKADLDEECHGLLDAVRRLNEINRKLRNLIAGNLQARLDSLKGAVGLYARSGTPQMMDYRR